MQQIDTGTIDLVFADPPFNIGYEYDQYHDRQEDEEYIAWSAQLDGRGASRPASRAAPSGSPSATSTPPS